MSFLLNPFIFGVSLPSDYKALYKFEDNGNDETTNHNATMSNVTYSDTGGVAAELAKYSIYNGTTSYGQVTDHVDVTDIKSYFCWIYLLSAGEASLGRIFSKGELQAKFTTLYVNDNRLQFSKTFSTTGGGWKAPIASIQYSTWYHVGYTYAMDNDVATNPILYINGSSVTLTEISTPVGTMESDTGEDLYIGNRQQNDSTLDARLDNAYIFDRLVSPAEALAIYNSEKSPIPIDYKALYKFEDNGNDVTGNHNATMGNVTYSDTGGVSAGLAKYSIYNGTTSYGQVTDHADITDIKSCCTWIYLNSYGEGSLGRIFDKTETIFYVADITSPGNQVLALIKFFDPNTGKWYSDSLSLSTGVWTHIGYTYDMNTDNAPIFYINGLPVNVNTIDASSGTPTSDTGSDLYISSTSATNTRNFDGRKDNLHFFNRVISASEVLNIYNSEKP